MTRAGGATGRGPARRGHARQADAEALLSLLRQDGSLSRAELARRAGLSKAMVSSLVDELITAGIVHETGTGATAPTGGRPPRLIALNPTSRCLVGVAIGARVTSVVIADALGSVLDQRSEPTGRGSPQAAVAVAAGLIVQALAEAEIDQTSIAAIGVVVPGIVDPMTSVCLLAPNLGWRDVPVAELLATRFSAPIFVHNTAQAVIVAEAEEGAAQGFTDAVCVYASTGIGAGMLRNGRILVGGEGVAGELGHCALPGGTERCNCGKVGCLETVASAPAIERDAARLLAAGRTSSLSQLSRPPTARDIGAASYHGDELATELIRNAAELLGMATSWLVNIVNPGIVILTGGLAEIGPPMLEPLEAAMRRHALPQAAASLTLRPAAFGPDAPLRGAVLLARQYADDHFRTVFHNDRNSAGRHS
ncbi:MAG TPA: ROK family transcriptional regulator [Mycobacteriales bacterium]|nr:ROK family transcriptional regulator [Mycobacteriales bacterium]